LEETNNHDSKLEYFNQMKEELKVQMTQDIQANFKELQQSLIEHLRTIVQEKEAAPKTS
jgi:hypothetical protein